MQAMTIDKTGAAGVALAISDAMQAAEYARRLKAVTAEADALRNELASEQAENRRLNKECRWNRFVRSRAYADALEAQVTGIGSRKERALRGCVIFLIGMVAGQALCFAIVWCSGV